MILKGLLFLCVFIPFQLALSPVEGIDLAFLRILIPVLFLFWVLKKLGTKSVALSVNAQIVSIFCFLFFCAFSLFVAQEVGWGVRKFMFLASFFPLYFVVADLKVEKSFSVVKFLIFGATLSAVVGIFQFFSQLFIGVERLFLIWSKVIVPFLGESFSEAVLLNNSWLVNLSGNTFFRATSFFPDPHIAAFYFGMTALVALGAFVSSKRSGHRYLFLISFLILLLADFLTFSRGGYLGFVAGIVFFGIFLLKEVDGNQIKRGLIVFTLVLIALFSFDSTRSRFISSFSITEGSNAARIETWKSSIDVANKNFILGVGLGNYPLSIKPSAAWREPIYSHNIYLDLLAEVGVFGMLSWFFVIFSCVIVLTKKFLRKKNHTYLGLAAGIVAFSVHSFFETALFSVHILTLLIIFMGISSIREEE